MAQITLDLPQGTNYDELFRTFRKIGLSTVTFSFLPSTEPPQALTEASALVETPVQVETPDVPCKEDNETEVVSARPFTPPPLVAGEPQPELSAELAGVYPGEDTQSMDIEDWAALVDPEPEENNESALSCSAKDKLTVFAWRLQQITDEDRKRLDDQIEGHRSFFNWE